MTILNTTIVYIRKEAISWTKILIVSPFKFYYHCRSVSADNQYEADREGSNEIIPPTRYVEFLKAERDEMLPPRYIEVRKGRIVLETQKVIDAADIKTDGKDSFSRFAKSKLALGSPTIPEPPDGYVRPMIRSQPQSPVHERGKSDSIGTNCSSRSEPCKNAVSGEFLCLWYIPYDTWIQLR